MAFITAQEHLNEVKDKMRRFTDLYGNSLYNYEDIDDCKNILDCESIIERHRTHLESMLLDATAKIDKFKKENGIF